MPFIHCRHNSIVYAVSKQHKHHSTYPSMFHCYEPGHFATFSPRFHFNTTFTHKTASYKPSGLTKWSPLSRCTDTFVCISDINSLYFGIWRRDCGLRLSHYYHQMSHIRNLDWAHFGADGWGTAFQVDIWRVRIPVGYQKYYLNYSSLPPCGTGVDADSNTNECLGCHFGIKATAFRADNFTTFMCRLFGISGSLKLLKQ